MSTAERAARRDGASKEGSGSLSQQVGDIIQRSRFLFIAVGAAILVVLLALIVVTEIHSSGDRAAAIQMDQISRDGNAWNSETDATKKADLQKKLEASLDAVIAGHGASVWAQQAWDMKATIAESAKDWAEAEKDWMESAKILPGSFIAPASLQNAAVAAEELGANDRAAAHWKAFVDQYAGKAPGIAHAWFALGRLAEDAKDYTSAIADYEKIASNWPTSDWTKLAKDRILTLKSQGLAK